MEGEESEEGGGERGGGGSVGASFLFFYFFCVCVSEKNVKESVSVKHTKSSSH